MKTNRLEELAAKPDTLITAGMLANRLRPIVLGGETACLDGAQMIPLHRATVTSIYMHLERLAEIDGEETTRSTLLRGKDHG